MSYLLIHGDCLAVMAGMDAGSVDAVVTDPPYSSGTRREGAKGLRKSMNRTTEDDAWFGTDSLTTSGFEWLMRACALQWHRLLVPGGHVLVFIDWRMASHLSGAIESADLRTAGVIVWDKVNIGMGRCFRNRHEFVLHFTKGVGREPNRRDVANVIAVPSVRNGDHPTEKPLRLMQTLLDVVTHKGDTVLDSFMGSGTTGVACEGRHFIGIEREAEYVEIARRRIEAASAQERLPV